MGNKKRINRNNGFVSICWREEMASEMADKEAENWYDLEVHTLQGMANSDDAEVALGYRDKATMARALRDAEEYRKDTYNLLIGQFEKALAPLKGDESAINESVVKELKQLINDAMANDANINYFTKPEDRTLVIFEIAALVQQAFSLLAFASNMYVEFGLGVAGLANSGAELTIREMKERVKNQITILTNQVATGDQTLSLKQRVEKANQAMALVKDMEALQAEIKNEMQRVITMYTAAQFIKALDQIEKNKDYYSHTRLILLTKEGSLIDGWKVDFMELAKLDSVYVTLYRRFWGKLIRGHERGVIKERFESRVSDLQIDDGKVEFWIDSKKVSLGSIIEKAISRPCKQGMNDFIDTVGLVCKSVVEQAVKVFEDFNAEFDAYWVKLTVEDNGMYAIKPERF